MPKARQCQHTHATCARRERANRALHLGGRHDGILLGKDDERGRLRV
eukprot:CAMPEP_0181247876 /NCGR_PEP_ID=MMETSP1096-20121128/44858_1 /TAXON_ID=156174 ORGANISM="Chrysochromulina ericina, Strain CCMP281" /NCGR_SAMPLE_ID=MMETSP1096 /ASSEMBLY_ACC=CAM_ASM_000453 /LENGTH=46 /DNA_ID= /DNA_START= /DNA_END= /DNA_ORIENTATION=